MSNKSPLLNIMSQSLNKVTRNIVRDFGEIENLQIASSSINDFVSKTEKKIYESLSYDLTKSRPEWGIKINKNFTGDKDKYYWIVETLNGKYNFLHGLPYFCITISVEYNNEIIATIILDPLRDETFFAEKGKGSFVNDRRIRVTKRASLNSCIFSIYNDKKSNKIQKINCNTIRSLAINYSSLTREFGSSALSFAWLACGKIDCLFIDNLDKNQIACGSLLIKEAGGYLTNTKYIDAYKSPNEFIIGANPTLHKEILKKLNNMN